MTTSSGDYEIFDYQCQLPLAEDSWFRDLTILVMGRKFQHSSNK